MFKNANLAKVLEFKFKDNPNFSKGISTRRGELTEFPPDIGPFPTDSQLQQWVNEWEALPPDDVRKDPEKAHQKARAQLKTDIQGATSIAALKALLLRVIDQLS